MVSDGELSKSDVIDILSLLCGAKPLNIFYDVFTIKSLFQIYIFWEFKQIGGKYQKLYYFKC